MGSGRRPDGKPETTADQDGHRVSEGQAAEILAALRDK